MSVAFDDICLLPGEKKDLRLLRHKKRVEENKIKHIHNLYVTYDFIHPNYSGKTDLYGVDIPDGTYSLTDNYQRYRVFRIRKTFETNSLIAGIVAAVISGVVSSIVTLLLQ